MSNDLLFWLILLTLAGSGVWFRSFLREWAKNVASKKDLGELTRITEDIKADIANKVWVEQKRWDLKRDLYWKLIETISDLDGALASINSALSHNRQPSKEQMDKWFELRASLIRIMALSHLILSNDAISAFYEMGELDQSATAMTKALGSPGEVPFTERMPVVAKLRAANKRLFDLIVSAAKEDLILKKEEK